MADSVETNNPGPRDAHVHGYKPAGQPNDPNRQPDPNGLITITDWFKDEDMKYFDGESFPAWERRQAAKFENDAKVYEVLAKNLPGGTLHRYLAYISRESLLGAARSIE